MIIALLSTVSAAEVAVVAEGAVLAAPDPRFDAFGEGLAGLGASVSVRPSMKKRFPMELRASWNRSRRQTFSRNFTSTLTTDSFALGPRFDVDLWKVLSPYVSAQALLVRGSAHFDDDVYDKKNAGSVKYRGLTGGALLTTGVEVSTTQVLAPVELLAHVEGGAQLTPDLTLGQAGAVQPMGFFVRMGLGLRFGRK